MECHRVRNLLNAYIDRELDSKTEAEVRSHLVDCDSCYEEYISYVNVKSAVANMDNVRPSEEFSSKLKSLFEDDDLLKEELKRVRYMSIKRMTPNFSVFHRHAGAFAVVAAVAVTAAFAGMVSNNLGISNHSRAKAAASVSASERSAELPRIAYIHEWLVTEEELDEKTLSSRYKMRERMLMKSSKKRPSDSYKLYCTVYRSR